MRVCVVCGEPAGLLYCRACCPEAYAAEFQAKSWLWFESIRSSRRIDALVAELLATRDELHPCSERLSDALLRRKRGRA